MIAHLEIDLIHLGAVLTLAFCLWYGRRAVNWCLKNLYIGHKDYWRDDDGVWHKVK
jgi:hypothetical protein